MLHEALPASSDAARLHHAHDDRDSVPDDVFLGHDLVDAPPEVRAAAVSRSRRLPEPHILRTAWASLPPAVRDQIGALALTHSFYSVTGETDPQSLTLEAGNRAADWSYHALNAAEAVAVAALPELFGTPEAEPVWARQDGFGLALQVGAEAEEALQTAAVALEDRLSPARAAVELHGAAFGTTASPVLLAIARHRAAWGSLKASAEFFTGLNDPERMRLAWPAEEAEDEARADLLMLPALTPEDGAALLAHLCWYLRAAPGHPKRPELHPAVRALVEARAGDLALAMVEVRGRELSEGLGRPQEPVTAGETHGVMAAAVAAHRAAWSAYRAAPGEETEAVAHEAAEAVLAAPCGNRGDAEALVAHARWYSKELAEAGEDLADGLDAGARELAARAGTLGALVLAEAGA